MISFLAFHVPKKKIGTPFSNHLNGTRYVDFVKSVILRMYCMVFTMNHVERVFHVNDHKNVEITNKPYFEMLSPSDVPGVDCKIEGDPNYPEYVNCKDFSDSQKVRNYLMHVSRNLTYTHEFMRIICR